MNRQQLLELRPLLIDLTVQGQNAAALPAWSAAPLAGSTGRGRLGRAAGLDEDGMAAVESRGHRIENL